MLRWRVLLLAGLLPLAGRAETGAAEAQLRELLALQHELLGRAAQAVTQEEVEVLRPRLQTLVFDYERFLRTYPKNVEGYVAYSMLLGSTVIEERARAQGLLLKANALDPQHAVVKNQLGKYLAEDGKPLEALNYFLAAVELEPQEALYHFQIGQLLGAARDDFLKSGEWTVEQVDVALVHALEEAVRLDPQNFAYAYRLAESPYDVAEPDWEAALAAWRALQERSAEDPLRQQMLRLHEANVLLALERLEEAEAVLAGDYPTPLQEQRAALLAKLERRRNPSAEGEAPELASARPAKPAQPAVAVPSFKVGEVGPIGELNASTVVEIAKQLPAELPTAPLGDEGKVAEAGVGGEEETPLAEPNPEEGKRP